MTTLYLADTSAFTVGRRSDAAVTALRRLAADDVLATFVTVDLELGYSARGPREHRRVADLRRQLVQLEYVDEIAHRARAVQASMAARSQHRAAGIVDLLTAAAAEHHQAVLLHYDADFDHVAEFTGQRTEWVVAKGSA